MAFSERLRRKVAIVTGIGSGMGQGIALMFARHGALAHCAGKGGVLALTRQMAAKGGQHNIRANSISPGLIVTDATKPALELPGHRAGVLEKTMTKRLGELSGIVRFATYLVSDEAS